MIMKILTFCLSLLFSMASPLAAGNSITVGKVTNAQGVFSLVKEKNDEKTTLALEIDQDPTPIWTRTFSGFAGGGSILDYWQIIDAYKQRNDVAFLVSTHQGLMWVKATKANGTWNVDFEQEIYGAASPALKSKEIAMNGCDSVVVTNDQNQTTTFTRNSSGAVLKNGMPYSNTPPYIILTKP